MPTIDELKEQELIATPLFLFECVLPNGSIERWGTHQVTFDGHAYNARLLKHNLFEFKASSEEGFDGPSKISVTLANADSHFSQIERETGFKGSRLTIRFLFYDLAADEPASEDRILFRGLGNTAEEITESSLRVSFADRLNLQRILLPEVRVQRRCPWSFPATLEQRQEALAGEDKGKYSALYRCGYSAGLDGGEGLLDGSSPFTTCDYTRTSCTARGMFSLRRFGGIEFVPPQIQVRGYGESGTRLSPLVDNQARYNDVVPIVYGTAWYEPSVVFSRNDGNLTIMEVLLGMGQIDEVVKVLVNDVEIPEGVAGADMTATGWYSVVTSGERSGQFNPDFKDASGNPLGDPYGSMAMASIVAPNRVATGTSLPRVKVLMRGVKLERFDGDGVSLGEAYSNNPAWISLDILRRSGWLLAEVDTQTFATAAAYCDELIDTTDLYGNAVVTPRFQCNLVVRNRRSSAEIIRSIRTSSTLQLGYGIDGRLTLRVENTIALQQPDPPAGTNSTESLNEGWPAYEFSDGSAAFSGILRRAGGEPAIRLFSRGAGDTPNRFTVEFQDQFNEYQQDSLSLVDVDDALLTGREVTAASSALGLPNFDQAARVLDLQLAKSIGGNTFVELETTVRGVNLLPGDIITVTYLKEGLERQPFRIVRLAPGLNFETVLITAQWHEDGWYTSGGSGAGGGRRRHGAEIGLPRPLVGTEIDENGLEQFGITERAVPTVDGGLSVVLSADFKTPSKPSDTGVNVPLAGLNPIINPTGGTLPGGVTWYYAVSAKDADGSESGLSFLVRAKIPAGTNTNAVVLSGLSIAPEAEAMNVYRGASPAQLLLISEDETPDETFTDTGLDAQLQGPPDANYDHAAFYWRLEQQPEANVETHSATSAGNSSLGMVVDEWKGSLVTITRGKGARQERTVIANDATSLTVSPAWRVEPDSTSYFVINEATWRAGGTVEASPVQFEVPGIPGATVQISGRSANVLKRESAYELNPLTRWQIASSLTEVDTGTPPAPVFGLSVAGGGTVDLVGLGFTTFDNTRDIEAATLSLFYWNELDSPSGFVLSGDIDDSELSITLNSPGPAVTGILLQIDGEILEVVEPHSGGAEYEVIRGSHGSGAAAHSAGAPVYHLQRTIRVIPLVRGLFGSPAVGSYRHSMYLPDIRVGAAELFMTNRVGNGLLAQAAFGSTADQGLRTLSGGQLTFQVPGYLATQTDATPVLSIDATHAVRDIFATVGEAPDGGPVELTLRQGSTEYCTLLIPEDEMLSDPVVNGFGLVPLEEGLQLHLDITSVPGAANTLPGRDLTVTLRF